MTTIAAARKGRQIAIGADTLCKDGYVDVGAEYRINDSKILKINDSIIASTGFCGWNLVFSDYFDSLESEPDFSSVGEIFATISSLHRSLKDDYFLNAHADEDDSFENSHFDCLVANPYGIFSFFTMRNVIEYSKFYALGSGFRFALGAMRAIYEQAASAEDIVRVGLEAAADFDENTAEPLEIYTVDLLATSPADQFARE